MTIAGQLFVHMLCVLVLPYSNWQWATVCLSESMVALRKGVQRALFQLGRVPEWHQTDNSTAATHRIADALAARVAGSKRPFNVEYVALMAHLGMKPRTIGIGESEQNGDVEAANGVIKRRLGRCCFEAAATSTALRHGSPSLTRSPGKQTRIADVASARSSRRCASSW